MVETRDGGVCDGAHGTASHCCGHDLVMGKMRDVGRVKSAAAS